MATGTLGATVIAYDCWYWMAIEMDWFNILEVPSICYPYIAPYWVRTGTGESAKEVCQKIIIDEDLKSMI